MMDKGDTGFSLSELAGFLDSELTEEVLAWVLQEAGEYMAEKQARIDDIYIDADGEPNDQELMEMCILDDEINIAHELIQELIQLKQHWN